MTSFIRPTLLLLAGLAAASSHAAEGYSLWDDFSASTLINTARWQSTERTRFVQSGVLQFVQRDLGSQTDNTGLVSNSWGSNMTDPTEVTQMRAFITVNQFNLTHCDANTQALGGVQARIVGAYFNAGPGAPTSRINDIGATARLIRETNSTDPAGTLRVQGLVFRCTTTDCNYGSTSVGSVDLGTAATGETVTLKMEWEPNLNRFNFYRGSGAAQRVTYDLDDSMPPFFNFRQIGTRTSAANCLSGPRTEAFVDAKFDNFAVNASAIP